VSGNVSLYNETDGTAILPTPSVAAVGQLRDEGDIVTQWFKHAGDVVILLGHVQDFGIHGLGSSEYVVSKLGRIAGGAPKIDLAAEVRLQKVVLELARAHLLQSAHDVSDGGLGVALAECCTTAPNANADVGARIDLPEPRNPIESIATLFGEDPSRIVISVRPGALAEVLAIAQRGVVQAAELGVTGGHSLSIAFTAKHGDTGSQGKGALQIPLATLRDARERCLESIVGK
jgi:phosphoribosylformylglycinamidine synthase subunit PurL